MTKKKVKLGERLRVLIHHPRNHLQKKVVVAAIVVVLDIHLQVVQLVDQEVVVPPIHLLPDHALPVLHHPLLVVMINLKVKREKLRRN